ncbi:hypothetical protein O6H91_08G008500 [Diphasiastrum complanatum]|uniref:Uncharacterized protein n=1 Tax=Diphasiastrum complanatum TaxID=34168 RepID=A0ACC2CV37_DIPCM|nr:hypothetical protein O6H91_Y137600 [Diphasiastrum complanatum]KAJ7545753.1 hypothetical protein O6H91_08G008500 [Diphasiastrum complanatum]
MGRAPCCNKVGISKGPWKPEEDQLLIRYIEEQGEGNWRAIPKQAGLLRCGKSCRLRWLNYLSPNTKRGNISEDEEDLIVTLHSLLGNRWSLIAGRIPGRTDNEIKNYWNTRLSKKLISKGLHTKTHKAVQGLSCHSSRKSKDHSKENYCRNKNRKSHTSIIETDCRNTETGSRKIPVFSGNTGCPSSAEDSEENDLIRQNNSLLHSHSNKTMELDSPSYSFTSSIDRSESFPSRYDQTNSLNSIYSPLQAAACFDFDAELLPLDDSTLRPNRSSNKIMQFPSSFDKELNSTSTDYSMDCIKQENDTSEMKFDTESLQQLQSLSFWNDNLEIDDLWDSMDKMPIVDSYSSSSILSNESQKEDYLSDIFSNFYYTAKPDGSTAPIYKTHELEMLKDVDI